VTAVVHSPFGLVTGLQNFVAVAGESAPNSSERASPPDELLRERFAQNVQQDIGMLRGEEKSPSKLMAKELRSKGTLRAQVPVACVVCSSPLIHVHPHSHRHCHRHRHRHPQLTVLVFCRTGFHRRSTWIHAQAALAMRLVRLWCPGRRKAIFTCSGSANASPMAGLLASCGGLGHGKRRQQWATVR
jgi:hypothetical protein